MLNGNFMFMLKIFLIKFTLNNLLISIKNFIRLFSNLILSFKHIPTCSIKNCNYNLYYNIFLTNNLLIIPVVHL